MPTKSQLDDINSIAVNNISPSRDPKIFWMKQYGQSITPESSSLIALAKTHYEFSDTSDIEAQIDNLINIKQEEEEDVSEIISHVKDGIISSIYKGQYGAVEEGLEVYTELIRSFLGTLSRGNALYNKEITKRERHSLGGGWGEIKWIRSDFIEIINAAISIDNFGAIEKVYPIPFRITLLGLSKKDYYIFEEFLEFVPFFYQASFNMTDERSKEHIIRFGSLRLSEILKFYIIPNIERTKDPEILEENKNFAIKVIVSRQVV